MRKLWQTSKVKMGEDQTDKIINSKGRLLLMIESREL